jgi:hypothetical protein
MSRPDRQQKKGKHTLPFFYALKFNEDSFDSKTQRTL